MENFKVENFGPIRHANVDFGDLTILLGPQASGKSLFLELFKLVKDKNHIVSTLKSYNYILEDSNSSSLLEYYFGEGLSSLMSKKTLVKSDDINCVNLITTGITNECADRSESVFYVPAQRILSITDGRPKNFMEFDFSTPYPLRHFSETLRVFLQSGLGNPEVIFPIKTRIKNEISESINNSIFHNGEIIMDQSGGQRKMKMLIDGVKLPFMTWSAGQKEFMPLLLAIYRLTASHTHLSTNKYEWVIIEEPEMGLHPRAIESVIIEIINLMQSGYHVIISTHSSIFLDFAWAIRELSYLNKPILEDALCKLFNLNPDSKIKNVFDGISRKKINTYYFNPTPEGVTTIDISSLDVMSDNPIISEWGGISTFASRASEIVSEYGRE